MAKSTIRIIVARIQEGAPGKPDIIENTLEINSKRLELDEAKAMQKELLPLLSSFIDVDTDSAPDA